MQIFNNQHIKERIILMVMSDHGLAQDCASNIRLKDGIEDGKYS